MNSSENREESLKHHRRAPSRRSTETAFNKNISSGTQDLSPNAAPMDKILKIDGAVEDDSDDEEDNGSENDHYVDIDVDEDDNENNQDSFDDKVDRDMRARLQTFFEVTAIGEKFTDLDISKLPSSVSGNSGSDQNSVASAENGQTLAQACAGGDIELVKLLLKKGKNIHEATEDGESLLSLAASSGYLELCRILLAMNADVEDRGRKGDCSPLMEASCAGYDDIMKLLIDNGADVNAKSTTGNTALHYAACNGHEKAVKLLIASGAHVEIHNENGHTPLMEAASSGRVGVAKILLESGAGINTHSNEFKETALTLACYKGHLELVKYLLQCGADHEHKTDEMHTALMEASMDGHVEVARLLLDSGAQVNMPTDSFESPLTLAACGGHVELANLLLERNANIEEANDEGYTPLMEAAREGHEEMCALLLAHGADINAQTEETQETPLTLACCGGFQEVADFLIKAGADIELGCSTPLMEASQEGHLELVKYILKCGANVHAKTQSGDTAFILACENGHTDTAEVLLSYGAGLEHESEGGKTALMKAAKSGHLCTVQFLINQGADVNKATLTNDQTVLSLACSGGHLSVVELLLKNHADPGHKLKDCSTMLIEAAKGGHAQVVKLLLDWTGNVTSSSCNEMSPSSPIQSSLDTMPVKSPPQSSNFVSTSDHVMTFNNISVGSFPLNDGRLLWTGLPSHHPSFSSDNNNLGCCYPSNLGAITQQPFLNMQLMTSRPHLSNDAQFLYPSSQVVCKDVTDDNRNSMPNNNNNNQTNETLLSALLASNVLASSSNSSSICTPSDQLKSIFKNFEILPVTSEEGGKTSMTMMKGAENLWHQKDGSAQDCHVPPNLLDAVDLGKGQTLNSAQTTFSSVLLPSSNSTKEQKYFPEYQTLDVAPGFQPFQLMQMEHLNSLPALSKSQLAKGLLSPSYASDSEGSDNAVGKNTPYQKPEEEVLPKSDFITFSDSDLSSKEILDVVSKLKKIDFESCSKLSWQEKDDLSNGCSLIESLTQSGVATDDNNSKNSSEEMPASLSSLGHADDIDLSTIVLLTELQQQQANLDLAEKDKNKNVLSSDASNFSLQWNTSGQLQQLSSYPQSQQNTLTLDQATSQLWQQQFEQMLQWQQQQQLVTQQFFQQQQIQQQQQITQQLQKQHFQQLQQDDQQARWNQLDPSASSPDVKSLEVSSSNVKCSSQLQMMSYAGDVVSSTQEKMAKLEFKFENFNTSASSSHAHKILVSSAGLSGEGPSAQPQLKTTSGRVFVRGHRKLPTLQKQQQLAAAVAGSASFTNDPCLHPQLLQLTQLTQQTGSSHLDQLSQPHSLMLSSQLPVDQAKLVPNVATSGCNIWHQVSAPNHLDLSTFIQFQQQQLKNKSANKQFLHFTQPSSQPLLANVKQDQGQSSNACIYSLQHQHMYLPSHYQSSSTSAELQTMKQAQNNTYLTQQENLRAQAYQYQLHTAHQIQQLLQQQQKPADACAASVHLAVVSSTNAGSSAVSSFAAAGSPLSPHELFHKQAQQFQQLLQNQHQQQFIPINQANQKHLLLSSCGQASLNQHNQQSSKLFNNGGLLQSQPFQLMSQQQQLFLQQQLNLHHQHHLLSPNNLKSSFLMQPSLDSLTISSPLSPPTSLPFDVGQITTRCPIDVDAQTEGNHDTALTLACAGGYAELVELLLQCNANIEHKDKKGFSPLILAATGGHIAVVEILLDHNADIEAQSERTKDTALSLACSGGRYEVVELLLNRGANKEHRNVSDYTPLSLAASGGYDNIINLLLDRGAEINSRTGSKLGISPLMLAAMNGHVSTVKLLLDKGSDINAQIETNRNTALTLACFQGRHEVVSVLVERKANIEHRAKTGLTPLMEAASGGYVEVGKVLLDRGADVNAAPVPSSRDTALTIASDKGHHKFVELLLSRKASVDVKNKKGNSPLWLSCNGGHLEVVQHLVHARADVDSQDNRKVSCLMAAFRKGHTKVVKWLVKHVVQFPSQQDCLRCLSTINDKDLQKKCQVCMEVIDGARENQAAEANRNANNLLLELDREKTLEENRRAAAARKREKKKQKKKKKLAVEESKEEAKEEEDDKRCQSAPESKEDSAEEVTVVKVAYDREARNDENLIFEDFPVNLKSEEICQDKKTKTNKKNRKERKLVEKSAKASPEAVQQPKSKDNNKESAPESYSTASQPIHLKSVDAPAQIVHSFSAFKPAASAIKKDISKLMFSDYSTGIGDLDDFGMLPAEVKATSAQPTVAKEKPDVKTSHLFPKVKVTTASQSGPAPVPAKAFVLYKASSAASPKKSGRKDEGWKEVTRKCKKLTVPGKAVSRIIGRGGCNINAIREVSTAHIDLDKVKNSTDGVVTIKGSAEATKLAIDLIEALIRETDKDIDQIIPMFKNKIAAALSTSSSTKAWTGNPLKTSNVSSLGASSLLSNSLIAGKMSILPVAAVSASDSHAPNAANSTFAWNRGSKASEVLKFQPTMSFTIGPWSPLSQSGQNAARLSSSVSSLATGHKIGGSNSSADAFSSSCSVVNAFAAVQIRPPSLVSSSSEYSASHIDCSLSSSYKVSSSLWGSQSGKSDVGARSLMSMMNVSVADTSGSPGANHSAISGSLQIIPQYSPFKTFFSSSSIIGNEMEKSNFSENRPADAPQASAPIPVEPEIDSALQAKAPGYRPLVLLSSSPRKVNTDAGPPNKDVHQLNAFPDLEEAARHTFGNMSNNMCSTSNTSLTGLEPVKSSTSSSSVSYLVPAGPGSPDFPSISSGPHKDEYISSRNPMTLPHIDSNLNPNAPDFTTKTSFEFGSKMIATGPQPPAYFHQQQVHMRGSPFQSIPSYSLFSAPSISSMNRFPTEVKPVPFPLPSVHIPLSSKEISIVDSALFVDQTGGGGGGGRLDQGTPSSSNPSSPNIDDRRSIQPIGTELRSKKQRIMAPAHPSMLSSSVPSFGYNFPPNNNNVPGYQPQWQPPYQGEMGNGDWRGGPVNSVPSISEGSIENMSSLIVPPRPNYLPAIMNMRYPDVMRSPQELIGSHPIRPVPSDRLYENSFQGQQGPMLPPHGGSNFANGFMAQTVHGPYMPNFGMLRSAGDGGWESGPRQKLQQNSHVWNNNGWQPNPHY